jgi:hypothetical protein
MAAAQSGDRLPAPEGWRECPDGRGTMMAMAEALVIGSGIGSKTARWDRRDGVRRETERMIASSEGVRRLSEGAGAEVQRRWRAELLG